MKTLLMFGLIFFSACFTILFSQADCQNPGASSASFLVKGNKINFEFHSITDKKNSYALQSNASPQQIWCDINNPDFLHTVFSNSQQQAPWFDRTCIYFGSTDSGTNWFELGPVPESSRAGYPAIYGTSNGEAVIVNHSSYFDMTTRTGIFIDNSPFEYNFTSYDPGVQPPTLWPRCIVTSNNLVFIAAYDSGNIAFNMLEPDSSTFSGWLIGAPTRPESYSLCISDAGKIGIAFVGGDGIDEGDVFYFESTDNGITWSVPIRIFDRPDNQNISKGALRGVSLNFYGEEPCVVFEIVKQDFNSGTYFSREPSEIHFWSPNISGGLSKAIADSNNVPFAASFSRTDVFAPVCRPVIGRSQSYDYLLVAFSVATENVLPGPDSTTYFAGYFMYSSDGGESWANPEKFTPNTPLLDWRYISIAPICPVVNPVFDQKSSGSSFVKPNIDDLLTIHMTLQGDSLTPYPHLVRSAKYYHVSSIPPIVHSEKDPVISDEYKLEQNYPNPFNPTTKIKFTIPPDERSETRDVNLKVYDVLGNETAILVNEEKPAGEYEVEFDGTNQTSGIYFYQLRAGGFVETKKMILMK